MELFNEIAGSLDCISDILEILGNSVFQEIQGDANSYQLLVSSLTWIGRVDFGTFCHVKYQFTSGFPFCQVFEENQCNQHNVIGPFRLPNFVTRCHFMSIPSNERSSTVYKERRTWGSDFGANYCHFSNHS